MKFEYSEDLRNYLTKKGRTNLVLRTISPTGCCGGAPELIIDPVKDSETESAKEGNMRTFDTDMGRVLMELTLVPEDPDATVSFGLKRFLGLADITATGLRQLA